MADRVSSRDTRGSVETRYWQGECKDCLAEKRMRAKGSKSSNVRFEYSGAWTERAFELGQSRSDRCEHHRRLHQAMIAALSVPYVDLRVTAEVRDRNNPTGPLGGLGPLPKPHCQRTSEVDLGDFGFGMGDGDVLTILAGLRDKRVAVVEAGTGTGKSTFMPFRLMSPPAGALFHPTRFGPIVVTEPRRQAATGVATFVGESLVFGHDPEKCHAHVGPGFPVGYQVSQDRKWDGACDLIYVTDGTMINWIRDGSLARIGMVIVDEAHERSANIDIILAQLRERLKEYKHLRVVITSATIDRDFFVDYFGGPSQVFHHSVPGKKSYGYGVPLFVGMRVDERLIADGLTLSGEATALSFSGWSGFGPIHEGFPPDDLVRETAKYAKLRCGREIPMEKWVREMPRALAEQVVSIAEGTEFGDILGFLPTTMTIQEAIGHIRNKLNRPRDFDIYPLLSKTPSDITKLAVAARRRGDRRKIVISSNLAETSLTVRGVRYVVDSGLICQSEWNPDLGKGGMPKLPHSQSGLRQRWGRVGRDAPGWVFPLYTIEQFQSLPRDTPPATTRENLEEFCIRLVSSGLDPEKAVLPGNFASENYQPDDYGKASAEIFTKELARANLTLKIGGLVDADGDLTALGAEIDRYSGPASEALAVALGDRLACLHEVALCLALVARGKLHGKYGVLRIDFDWPPEWRLRAKTCHRALAVGCRDDLDLALRLAMLYQEAKEPARWCRTWWVNREALDLALSDVSPILAKLSAAMKQEVSRPYMPELLPRARAAITQAFLSHAYRDIGDGRFESIVDGQLALGPGKLLVPDATLIMGFDRYETGDAQAPSVQRIGHFISVDPAVAKAANMQPGRIPDDFDLLIDLADRRRAQVATPPDILHEVRRQIPIGTVVRLDFDSVLTGTGLVKSVERLADPFQMPSSVGAAGGPEEDSGFDPNWDLRSEEESTADAETEERVVDPRKLEMNDTVRGDVAFVPLPTLMKATGDLPPLKVRTRFPSDRLERGRACVVSDYGIDGGTVVLLVEPVPEFRGPLDPAWHDDLEPLGEVELQFLGSADDSLWSFLCFRLPASNGRIDVATEEFLSLDRYARSTEHELKSGDRIRAVVVCPRQGRKSVSIAYALRAGIDAAPKSESFSRGKLVPTHSGVVRSEPNAFGSLEVTLAGKWAPVGATTRVQCKAKDMDRKSIPAELGQVLEVSLASTVGEDWALGPLSDRLEAIAKQHSAQLEVEGNRVYARGPIPIALARKLLVLDDDMDWSVKVSHFFQMSHRLCVTDVFPALHRRSLTGSKVAIALIKACRPMFEVRFGVKAEIGETGLIIITARDQQAVSAAANYLSVIDNMHYIVARVPQAKIGRVLGKGGANLRALGERPGLDWVWLADDQIYLLASHRHAVEGAFAQVRQSVDAEVGVVTVPHYQRPRFIGKGGETIRTLQSRTDCRIYRTEVDGMWKIEAPSKTALDLLLSLARSHASDLSYAHEVSFRLELLVDHDPLGRANSREARSTLTPVPPAIRTPPPANQTPPPAKPGPSVDTSARAVQASSNSASAAKAGLLSRILSRLFGA